MIPTCKYAVYFLQSNNIRVCVYVHVHVHVGRYTYGNKAGFLVEQVVAIAVNRDLP